VAHVAYALLTSLNSPESKDLFCGFAAQVGNRFVYFEPNEKIVKFLDPGENPDKGHWGKAKRLAGAHYLPTPS